MHVWRTAGKIDVRFSFGEKLSCLGVAMASREPVQSKGASRISGTGVLMYSVGPNGIDESGKSGTGGRAGDDFSFWPR